jgi:hypothetical protein
VAAADRIEDEYCTLEAAEGALAEVVLRDITPAEADEKRLAIPDSPSVVQHVLNVPIRQISLRETLNCMKGD